MQGCKLSDFSLFSTTKIHFNTFGFFFFKMSSLEYILHYSIPNSDLRKILSMISEFSFEPDLHP